MSDAPDRDPREASPAVPRSYPAWAQELARKYLTGTLAQFVLHGNTHDLVPSMAAAGNTGPSSHASEERAYVALRDFLAEDLFAARDHVVFYDRSAGLQFRTSETRRDFLRALEGHDAFHGTSRAPDLPTNPGAAFALLEHYFRLRLAAGKRVACIIDYAETVAPAAEAALHGAEDRRARIFLQKWAREDERRAYLDWRLGHARSGHDQARVAERSGSSANGSAAFEEHSDVSVATLAAQTAGLGYVSLGTLLGDVLENERRLTHERLSAQKKELIEAEAQGLLSFVESDLDLEAVAGHDEAKRHLRDAARALQRGRRDVMPMGYLVSGPVGTGKTFLVNCFAGEIGVPMVELRNFRSQWQGVTEGNLERVFDLLEAMAPVAVLIDEADTALGTREATGDAGVSRRVFGRIASFMSDPAHRGRVVFFLVTARPDLVPVDLKRQGRAEEHLALFYPETRAGREELLRVMMRRTGVDLPMNEVPRVLRTGRRAEDADEDGHATTFSGADLEALLTRAKFQAAAEQPAEGNAAVTGAHLRAVTDDFAPPTYPDEIELQELAAAIECTRRSMLPRRLRPLDRHETVRRLQRLQATTS
ncbi:MAG: AAA family ATPase [Bacteroidetes bacterium QS_9_68_14]|nr:MAG: AAA family ATPase [Bacteroidetes bacterium QS_9_68_14]